MPDSNILARRAPLLKTSEGIVTPLAPATRFVLRVSSEDAKAVGSAGGFSLAGAINSAIGQAELFAARLGPDEWLLVADGDEIAADTIASDLAGCFHSLVDVSHRNAGIAVSGAAARAVLNAGVPLDLDDAAFPAGSATRTVLGKAEIVLVRTSAADLYRVECWRSFAPYVYEFLLEAARDFAPA